MAGYIDGEGNEVRFKHWYLKMLREAAGMSRQDLAEAIGELNGKAPHVSTIAKWEAGTSRPRSAYSYGALCRIFGLGWEDLKIKVRPREELESLKDELTFQIIDLRHLLAEL